MFPIDEEALILMVKILDNLEEFKELSGNMQAIMENDHNQEVRLLSLFNVLINGIQREYNQIGKIFWVRKPRMLKVSALQNKLISPFFQHAF